MGATTAGGEGSLGKRRQRFTWSSAIVDAARAGISPAEFHLATLREVSIRLKGALWREEQAARLSLRAAWYAAAFVRAKKLPTLRNLMREKAERVTHQSPEEQRAFFLEFARRAGLTVERHDKPVT